MKTAILYLIALALLCGAAIAEYRIAKDRTAGGLYVVGPDISPDSLEGAFIYYSPDAGTTLVVKDSSVHYSAIAADYTTGNVYKIVLERLYHSNDFGETWEIRVPYAYNCITGYEAGEVYVTLSSCFIRSSDYAVSYDTIPRPVFAGLGCLGWQSGEVYLLNSGLGTLYYSDDTLETCDTIYSFGLYSYVLITSGRTGEVYGLSSDSIYYSADYGSTFVGTNTFSMEPEESSLMEIVGGRFSGELYGVYVNYYTDEYYEQRGGSIRICYSRDYGATFTCLTHTAEGLTYDTLSGIEENSPTAKPEAFEISAHPNPFNSAVRITIEDVGAHGRAPSRVEIYDVNGRIIDIIPPAPLNKGGVERSETGGLYTWQPGESIGSGVYLVRAAVGKESISRRIVYLK